MQAGQDGATERSQTGSHFMGFVSAGVRRNTTAYSFGVAKKNLKMPEKLPGHNTGT